ncbi:hypothetical protein MOV08_20955 [Streptomyces yunnanensis]|uniref:Uncharacterized protein n=1 Tax=Streptomyces yunnanensis TaxID=156453 RepID=A0ABY8A9M9_9ACTN|nr:hypothetical protein [Streptomyces yunnanensis]WEB41493.1 hypothetical protein MOV08_20955 [Streptomyces yunnanensis]
MASIHELYQRAGLPGAPKIAQRTKDRTDLPDVVSHDTVTKLLKGQWIPAWLKVHAVVAVLAEYASHAPDQREEIERHHLLWMAERGLHEASPVKRDDTEGAPSSIMALNFTGGRDRDDFHAVHLRRRFEAILSSLLASEVHRQWLGDGVLMHAPGPELAIAAVHELLPRMSSHLLMDNYDVNNNGLLFVQGSLHIGPVKGTAEGGGWFGSAMVDATRMADAPVLRRAHELVGLQRRPGLAVLVSDEVRRAADPESRPAMCKVEPLSFKDCVLPAAWLYVPPMPWNVAARLRGQEARRSF